MLNSLLSVIFYLRVIVAMYMEEGGAEGKSFRQAPFVYVAIAIALIGTHLFRYSASQCSRLEPNGL